MAPSKEKKGGEGLAITIDSTRLFALQKMKQYLAALMSMSCLELQIHKEMRDNSIPFKITPPIWNKKYKKHTKPD